MIPAAFVGAVGTALANAAVNIMTGAANKALAGAGVAGAAAVAAGPSMIEVAAALGSLFGWAPETTHAVSVLLSAAVSAASALLAVYAVPNRPPKRKAALVR